MTTAERFWFALGWALGSDCVAPNRALQIMDEIKEALRNEAPGDFASFVLQYIYAPNEMRDEACALAERLAWERSDAAQVAEGEEALDAYDRHERAEGR